MYVTMLIAVPHYPDMIMAFVLSQTKSDLHLKNLRGKKVANSTGNSPCLACQSSILVGEKNRYFSIIKTTFFQSLNKIKKIIRNHVQF